MLDVGAAGWPAGRDARRGASPVMQRRAANHRRWQADGAQWLDARAARDRAQHQCHDDGAAGAAGHR
jgi:hypothetical protein